MNWSSKWDDTPAIPTTEVELTIPINGGWDTKKIKATQVLDLAVSENDEWLVIHVPTLTRFDKAIPEGEWTNAELIVWCWKVQQNTDLFAAISCYTNKDATRNIIPKHLLDALLEHCLSCAIF